VKEIWDIVKKYMFDIWGIFLGAWYAIKLDSISKFNQILLTVYILMLIRYKILEKRGKNPRENMLTKLFNKVIGRNQSVRSLNVGLNAEIQVEAIINLSEKIRKEGPEDMKTIWKQFGKGLTFARANKFTSLGNISVLGFYYTLMDELFKVHGYTLSNQSKVFYIWFGIYTVGALFALVAANGWGWDTIESYFTRKNKNKLTKLIDSLIGLSIATNAELVKEKLVLAFDLLEKVQPFIREEKYKNIKSSLTNISQELRKYNANKLLEEEKEKEELLRLAKQELQPQSPTSEPPKEKQHIRLNG
jgi:hypothetical protein